MELNGKKMNILGDSITYGFGIDNPDDIFPNLIQKKGDLPAVRNYGVCATRIARQKYPSDDPMADRDFCMRCETMDTDADIVCVFGGTNDYGHGDAPIGKTSDKTPDTFCGALNYLIQYLKRNFPNAFIFFITPLHRLNENDSRGDGSKKQPGPPLCTYVKAIKDVCAKDDVQVLDLYGDNSGPRNSVAQDYTFDGLHPNVTGHKLIAEKIIKFLKAQ